MPRIVDKSIEKILKKYAPAPVKISVIEKECNLRLRDVQKALIRMKKQGHARQAGANSWSYKWSKQQPRCRTSGFSDSQLESEVFDVLHKSKTKEVSIIVLKKELRRDKKEVNQVLYKLKDQGLISRTDSNPPRWYLLPNGRNALQTREKNNNAACAFVENEGQSRDTAADVAMSSESRSMRPVRPSQIFQTATSEENSSDCLGVSSPDRPSVDRNAALHGAEIEPSVPQAVAAAEQKPVLLTPDHFIVNSSNTAVNVASPYAEDLPLRNENGFPGNLAQSETDVKPTKMERMQAEMAVIGNSGRTLHTRFETEPVAATPESNDSEDKCGQVTILKRPSSQISRSSDDVERNLCEKASTSLSLNEDMLNPSSTKNAISVINEFAQANRLFIEFKYKDEGPAHKKRFLATLSLGDKTFPPVEGGSKKDAKLKAAAVALSTVQGTPVETTSSPEPMQTEIPVAPTYNPGNLQSSSKNSVSIVNEYAQANRLPIDFVCNIMGPDHSRRFSTVLKLGKQTFPAVEGSSKKESKLKAAESAIADLQSQGKIASHAFNPSLSEETHQPLSRPLHDRVAMRVKSKFEELLAGLPDTIVGRKIIAGFVMSRQRMTDCGEENEWIVVSVSSGNRCVAGDQLSMKGETVNDCHAEIISRRGLLRFLYEKLALYHSNPNDEENIFEKGQQDKLRLQDGVKFHLYISTAPCGDSALFAKSDMDSNADHPVDSDEGHRPLFDNKKQGMLRTKVENGEGCIPIEDDANVPTWDGLLRGERLRTMSCSDKLAKWNFLGLQGALLSIFVEPIYMSSLTLGMLYNHGHLTRAICCRLDKYLKQLGRPLDIPRSYKVHHPSVSKISGDDPGRDTGKVKTREFSVNWTDSDEFTEVLDGTKGRCEARFGCTNPVSQVCKANLYQLFKKIGGDRNFKSYAEAKLAAKEYQQAKTQMKLAFEKAGCGKWMNKPTEEDDFP